MDEQPFPLPRATRETEILNGDGGTVYGPFGFKIFDTEDVHAYVRHAGEDWQTAAVTAHKVAGLEFDDFTVTFAEAVPATSDYLVQASRLHGRQTAVTRGGAISGRALEKELSKQGSVIEELRRDVNRSGSVVPVEPGRVLIAGGDGRMRPGPSADEISGAQESASIALEAAEAAQDARDAALAAVPNAFPSDRTELKALNTATITAAYLKEAGREGQWLWDATVPVAVHQADTLEQRYIAPNPATDGAWVRACSVSTDTIYVDEGARILRIADRMLLGGEAIKFNGLPLSRGGDGGFLWDDTGGEVTTRWMEQQTILSVGGHFKRNGAVAFTGAIKGPGIGTISMIVHDEEPAPDTRSAAWASYVEGRRGTELGTTWGMELDIINLIPSPATGPFDPYGHKAAATDGAGTTFGLHIASGGGGPLVGDVYDTDVALHIANNGAKFFSGLVFGATSLVPDEGTGRMHAIKMAYNQAIEWHEITEKDIGLSIVSMVTDQDHKQELRIANEGLTLRGEYGNILFRAGWLDNAENYINLSPSTGGSSPEIQAQGAATNLSLRLRGKGAGGVILSDGAAATKIQVAAAGIGFYGATPVAKPSGVGVNATDIHAALVSLGLIAA